VTTDREGRRDGGDTDDQQNNDDGDFENRHRSRNAEIGKSPSDDDFSRREEAVKQGVQS